MRKLTFFDEEASVTIHPLRLVPASSELDNHCCEPYPVASVMTQQFQRESQRLAQKGYSDG